ncbi:hypothetical protein [Flavobacterium sp.]|uniref:hypothetical protein n=1 Tax=Flavobacterium sp. TaxID=239 RepID=UPI0037511751
METNKDFLLRSIANLINFIEKLFKKGKPSLEIVSVYIDNFFEEKYKNTINQFIEKPFDEVIQIIHEGNVENIKDFADVLFIRFELENTNPIKANLSEFILNLYDYYQKESSVYSLEIQSKILTLKKRNF